MIANDIEITDQLPEELQFEEITYIKGSIVNSIKNNGDNNIKVLVNELESGESIDITVTTKAKLLSDKMIKKYKTLLQYQHKDLMEYRQIR